MKSNIAVALTCIVVVASVAGYGLYNTYGVTTTTTRTTTETVDLTSTQTVTSATALITTSYVTSYETSISISTSTYTEILPQYTTETETQTQTDYATVTNTQDYASYSSIAAMQDSSAFCTNYPFPFPSSTASDVISSCGSNGLELSYSYAGYLQISFVSGEKISWIFTGSDGIVESSSTGTSGTIDFAIQPGVSYYITIVNQTCSITGCGGSFEVTLSATYIF